MARDRTTKWRLITVENPSVEESQTSGWLRARDLRVAISGSCSARTRPALGRMAPENSEIE